MKIKIPIVKAITYKEADIVFDLSNVELRSLFEPGEEIVVDFKNGHLLVFNEEGASNIEEKEYNIVKDMQNFNTHILESAYRTTRQQTLIEIVGRIQVLSNYPISFILGD